MAVVKGSRQDELVILQYRPGHKLRRNMYLLLAMLTLAVGGYFLGLIDSMQQIQDLSQQRDQLKVQLVEAEHHNVQLTQRVGVLEKGGEVDRKAADTIRQSVVELKSQITSLEEEVAFYKGIMAPNGNDRGLKVSKVDLVALSEQENRYRYSIKLMQVVDNSSFISGLAAVNFEGVKDNEPLVLPLRDLDKAVTELGVKFRFRYFQELSGEIVIPSDFSPTHIQIVLQATGSKSQRVEHTVDWPY